ncbi:hypothetical protein PAUR_b1238 [Pseudoalteromonas aurantia 208]|uniref:Uncharacterized protein n=1 Tax=Pseudoalteromonas aurantia 208 TaxID=1314867 RepID=A0ABR9EJ87_9GAMM|nr:hypothetical protein [Pseudoalteromonas aurantia 208]
MNIEKKYQNATTLTLVSTLLISAPVFFILSSLIRGAGEFYYSTILFSLFIDLCVKAIPAAIIYLVIKYTKSQAGYLFLTVFVSVTTLIIAFSYYMFIFGSTLFPTSALSILILVTPYVMLVSVSGLIIGLACVFLLKNKS